jgi:tetratricopeptide (TPR) repeat protein
MSTTPGNKIRDLIAIARDAASVCEWDTAIRYASYALDLSWRTLGFDHAETALPLGTLAWIYADNGKFDLAEEYGQAAIDLLIDTHQGDTQFAATIRVVTGYAMSAQGKVDGVESMLDTAMAGLRAQIGENHTRTLQACQYRAKALMCMGRWSEAERIFRDLLHRLQHKAARDGLQQYRLLVDLAYATYAQGGHERAIGYAEMALTAAIVAHGKNSAQVAAIHATLWKWNRALGDVHLAQRHAHRLVAIGSVLRLEAGLVVEAREFLYGTESLSCPVVVPMGVMQ